MTIWLPELAEQRPIYKAIVSAMSRDIAEGRLGPGERLPPQRELAYQLGVTVGTVTRAYTEAERQGLVIGEVGRGTFVKRSSADAPLLAMPSEPQQASGGGTQGFIDLSANWPPEPPLAEEIGAIIQDECNRPDLGARLQYRRDLIGGEAARRAVAGHLETEGLSADWRETALTNGAQHAIFVSLLATTRPDDIVLCEELTFFAIKSAARSLSLRLRGVAMDEWGLRPDALDAACRATQAKVLYSIPTLQNPTNRIMPTERRREIAEICRRHDVTIIEDSIYAFLLDEPPCPYANLAPERSIHVSSLSKSVAPNLRLGFLRAPSHLMEAMTFAVRSSSYCSPPFTHDVGQRLIESGVAARSAKAMREEARYRQELARRYFPDAERPSDGTPLHLWLELPNPWRSGSFVHAAYRAGVGVADAEVFAIGREEVPHAVRICLAAARTRDEMQSALARLAALLPRGPEAGPGLPLM